MIILKKYDERIPVWNLSQLINRNCPFCGSLESRPMYVRPDELTVVICCSCDTHYVSPSPSENELDIFYKSYYIDHAENNASNSTPFKVSAINIYDDVRINILYKLLNINGSEVLDVGCGNGEFLLKLKFLGAHITGIDLSLEAVEWARENGVEHAFQVSLESFGDDKKYDLIVLNDVVEHPLEPSKLIEKANSLLKSGGILSIWTPNNDNIFLDDQRKTLRVDLEHMQYLGSKACQYLSLTHNLNIVHYESLGYCTYSPNHNKNISKRILIFLLKFFHLYKLIKKIYSYIKFKNDRLGNYHLFVVLKKPLSNHIDRK